MVQALKPGSQGKQSSKRVILYWLATAVVCVVLVYGALSNFNLVRKEYVYNMLDYLGYPRYLATMLGICKLAATFVFLSPRMLLLKEWAYAGIVILFFAAFTSHVIVGDTLSGSAIPLAFGIVTIVSYVLRPPERRLPLSKYDEWGDVANKLEL